MKNKNIITIILLLAGQSAYATDKIYPPAVVLDTTAIVIMVIVAFAIYATLKAFHSVADNMENEIREKHNLK